MLFVLAHKVVAISKDKAKLAFRFQLLELIENKIMQNYTHTKRVNLKAVNLQL